MKKITKTELKSILASHKLWIESAGKQGTRASLEGANLEGANLTRANLIDADLCRANLTYANLLGANLIDADLTGANLLGANLWGANLGGANLIGADLTGTILDKEKEEKQPDVPPCRVENITSTCQTLEKIAKEYGFKIVSIGLEPL